MNDIQGRKKLNEALHTLFLLAKSAKRMDRFLQWDAPTVLIEGELDILTKRHKECVSLVNTYIRSRRGEEEE